MDSILTNQSSALTRLAESVSTVSFFNSHKADLDNGRPAVYCGTYHKYNCGSIAGIWVDITSFDDYEEFIDFCRKFHSDENDPELMFQDFANYPDDWYSECYFSSELFDKIVFYQQLADNFKQEAVEAFIDLGKDIYDFEEQFIGRFDSEEDFAEHVVSDCYDLDDMLGSLKYYFDYSAFARDLFADDYLFCDGFVFRNF